MRYAAPTCRCAGSLRACPACSGSVGEQRRRSVPQIPISRGGHGFAQPVFQHPPRGDASPPTVCCSYYFFAGGLFPLLGPEGLPVLLGQLGLERLSPPFPPALAPPLPPLFAIIVDLLMAPSCFETLCRMWRQVTFFLAVRQGWDQSPQLLYPPPIGLKMTSCAMPAGWSADGPPAHAGA